MAQHGSSVVLYTGAANTTPGSGIARVVASHFSAHHKVLRTTEDFIEAIRKAREITDSFGPRWAASEQTPPHPLTAGVAKLLAKPSGPQPNSVFPYR